MPDVLKGSLEQLQLPAVLRLLVTGGQTGRLDIRDGAKKGVVHLRQGQLIHAVEGPNMGVTALNVLTGWPRGDFNFVAGVACPEESIKAPTDELLTETTRRADQWKQIRPIIPDDAAVFRFSKDGMANAISLEPEDWRVLAQVNGTLGVAEIANMLSEDELAVALVLAKLANAGLLEVVQNPQPAPGAAIAGSFFSRLNDELVEIMGPIAPMIIDEAVASLGETKSALPRAKVAPLIEHISSEIDSADKRARFQQLMLGLLKQL
jgi:hypothetical protein